MTEGKITYLGLYAKYQPPIIGVLYKQRPNDPKKKLYTIILQKLVFHPDPMQAAKILYKQHPHILKQSKIPMIKIAKMITKIQEQLQLAQGDQYADDYEQQGQQYLQRQAQEPQIQQKKIENALPKPASRRPKFLDNEFQDDGPLNRSL